MLAFAKRHRVVLGTAALAMLMMAAVYILLGVWPFGSNTVLTGDLNSQYIPYFSHFQRFAAGQAGFAYGFDKALGGNLVGLFAYYVTSPLNLLYLLAPLRWFPAVAGFILFAKIVLACTFFSFFLHKKYPTLGFGAMALSLGYGFCTYCFVYAQNVMWLDVVVLLPLICLGIDALLAGKRPILYTIALALAIFANFYIAFMACLFALLYFMWNLLRAPLARLPAGWKRPALRFAAGSLIAAGLNAALLLPTLADVNQSKGALLAYTFDTGTNFSLPQLRERLVWGNFVFEDINGGLPFIYCGALALLLLVCYFAARGISLREKLLSAGVLVLFVLSFWLRGLDHLWHGLKAPVYFPARYSFIFCFFVLLLAARALARGALGLRQLAIGCGVLALVYVFAFLFPVTTSRARILLTFAAVLVFAALLWLALPATKKPPHFARLARPAAILLVLAVCGEMALGAYFVSNQLEKYPLTAYQQFVDDNGGAVQAVQAQDAASYRIADSWFRSLNDPMLLGYRGLSHFGSTANDASQDILYSLGYRCYDGMGPYMGGSTAFADSLLSLRYLCQSNGWPLQAHWQPSAIAANMPVLQNPTALPMAFAASADAAALNGLQPREDNSFQYQNTLYRALGGIGDLFTPAPAQATAADGSPVQADGLYTPGTVIEITAAAAGPHYALFTAPYYGSVRVLVNGTDAGEYFTPLSMGILPLGTLTPGDTVQLQFETGETLAIEGAWFYRMDSDKLDSFTSGILGQSAAFTLTDGHAEGTFTVAAGQTLFTSIPTSAAWSATVNGQAVPPTALGQFLTLPLQAGENTVILHYTAPGSGPLSRGITLACAALAVFYLLLTRRRRAAGYVM